MTTITDVKVALLSLFSDSTGYWNEIPNANLPSNVKIVSAGYDQTIQNPQVVVGDVPQVPGEWMSGKVQQFKPSVDIHTYIRQDLPLSKEDMGKMKKQRDAMNQNIRTILVNHSDRPTADIMFAFIKRGAIDRDVRTSREIMLHSITQAEVWYEEDYV